MKASKAEFEKKTKKQNQKGLQIIVKKRKKNAS
jgi:hypothetical protein